MSQLLWTKSVGLSYGSNDKSIEICMMLAIILQLLNASFLYVKCINFMNLISLFIFAGQSKDLESEEFIIDVDEGECDDCGILLGSVRDEKTCTNN